jgi:hypothetical protein
VACTVSLPVDRPSSNARTSNNRHNSNQFTNMEMLNGRKARRVSLGAFVESKSRASCISPAVANRRRAVLKQQQLSDLNLTLDTEELSECSTIISSMEVSAVEMSVVDTLSTTSQERAAAAAWRSSTIIPEEGEDEEGSARMLKDSILYQYCNSYVTSSPYASHSKSPNNEASRLGVASSKQLRLQMSIPNIDNDAGDNSVAAPIDRRSAIARWESVSSRLGDDPAIDKVEKPGVDKPPTSPVRRRRAVASPPNHDAAPKLPDRRSGFQRRASTGYLPGAEGTAMVLTQDKRVFREADGESPVDRDMAPVSPDRRANFRRRNSTGFSSSESLDYLLIDLTDDEEELVKDSSEDSNDDGTWAPRRPRRSTRPIKPVSISSPKSPKKSSHDCKSKKSSSMRKSPKSKGSKRSKAGDSTHSATSACTGDSSTHSQQDILFCPLSPLEAVQRPDTTPPSPRRSSRRASTGVVNKDSTHNKPKTTAESSARLVVQGNPMPKRRS